MSERRKNKPDKPRRGKKILILIIIIIIGFAIIYHISPEILPEPIKTGTDDVVTNFNIFLANQNSDVSIIKIGSDSMGYVTLEGPYGNDSSQVTIAYLIGQHPRESEAHDALEGYIKNNSNTLHYKYYIYKVHVTEDADDFSQGRMNGQLLAQKFVVPDINSKDYRLVVDIHSSNAFYYPEPYIFTPGGGGTSITYAQKIVNENKEWLAYYEPPEYTSPQYSTLPIKNNGTPALVFEAYGEPGLSVTDQIAKLVDTIEALR